MDRVVVSLKGEKEDLDGAMVLFRALAETLAQDQIAVHPCPDGFQLTLADLAVFEVKLQEVEPNGDNCDLELDFEWMDERGPACPALQP